MPERPAAERSEKPTPDRLRRAREEGQIPQSAEVPSAIMIGAMLLALALASGRTYDRFCRQVRGGLSFHGADGAQFLGVFQAACLECLWIMAPFLLAAGAASLLGSVLVGGWAFAPKAMRLDFSRLAPSGGLKNFISSRSVAQLAVSLAKLAVILAVAWSFLGRRWGELVVLQWAQPHEAFGSTGRLILGLGVRITLALAAIAGADLLYQRWHYRRELRMTRQEVKEELRQHELSPEVRGRIRAVRLSMARRRMLQAVPTADVVVTNPTHVAVALKYDAGVMEAPQVVAKGADLLCLKIREIALAHGVPVVERPELARALYAAADVGQSIPQALFVAVAEVLAMIYRLRGRGPRRRGRGER